jgi:choline-sulfatase
VQEPHDPFICGGEAFERYDADTLPLSPSCDDDLEGRPGIYRKAARVFAHMSDRQRREAAACYYASITEIDQQFGRLIDRVEAAGQLDRTLVVFTSDHGELLGAHGLYCKNFTAAEEVYRIPLVAAGPGVARGGQSLARVGLHDLAPTLLELTGCRSLNAGDSRSFASLLREPDSSASPPWIGYAEYFGGRMLVTQRVVWDDPWKFVFNGFDQDELYNLDEDPFEMSNRIDDPTCDQHLRRLVAHMWRRCRDTGDDSLYNSQYPILRVAPYGPSNTASC